MLTANTTATTTWQKLSDLLIAAGQSDVTNNSVTSDVSYIKNTDASISLHVGTGSSSPTYYVTVPALQYLKIEKGANLAQIWVQSASSTVAIDWAEGAIIVPTIISGVVGTITLTDNLVPKGSSGNLVNSSITDDGTTVTATEPFVSAHATTPYFETATGKTNTGYVNIKGKTSGALKLTTADATAQTVTVTAAAQTVGACTLTIPDRASNAGTFAFTDSYLAAEVTSDATNATATMANITDLSISLKASGVYVGRMVLKCSNSTAAEGIAVDFDGSSATMTAFAAGAGVLTGGTTVAVTTVSSALATDFDWSTITGETWITFHIGMTVNAAGTFIPRFRESTAHSSGTATVSRGSYIQLQRVS